ncbi:restriction endonuclease subunit S [Roseburia sp. MSJ-14]|uniref:restriction endonuclease subunit S n=1 Tax=Roseburia sp. MSJ-14 TaxID=2841514 RepID=UPI001C119CDB|nr:restriction endonuclease subunit S [Roseburia sp. MSJ-14]MBU5473582.1 restriction endonuclease subunit S [Roseburia sp. MSJ-14]
MNAQDLKNSILQLAVQGKLVEQRAEEGTARELLEQIKLEKDQLIKDKKIKKSKPLPEITEDEIPFEIPESWEWVRVGEIGSLTRGSGIKRTEVIEDGYPCIRYGELYTTYRTKFEKTVSFVTKELFDKCHKIHTGDVAMTLTGENKTDIAMAVTYEGKDTIAMGGDMTCWSHHMMNPLYLVYFINSPYAISCKRNLATGDIIIHISNDKLATILMPVPPLEEQHRIVAKIEEILPYIEQYDKAYTKLETFNKKFPEDMKKSILQLAMQGKLVEQRPEEGTADEQCEQIVAEKAQLIKDGKIKKEKPLPEITEDEIPFEIPASWKWVRLSAICEKIGSGSTPTGGKNVYQDDGILFLRSQNVYNDGLRFDGIAFISEELNRPNSVVVAKDILLNITGGSIGRCALVPDDFDKANINQHVMIIRLVNLDLRFWVHFVIISAYIQQKIMDVQVGVSREGLSAEKLKNFIIPLPPLAEQKRIVAKIEELLPYCDQLIKC